MSYARVIISGNVAEIYKYDGYLSNRRGKRAKVLQELDNVSHVYNGGEGAAKSKKQTKVRSKESSRRSSMDFYRLVRANLGRSSNPVLVTLTYAENMVEIGRGRKDFNAFVKRAKAKFGEEIKYIAVVEFQRRGAIHFHAFFWGLPSGTVETERSTRVFARLWGKGFTDLKKTDGHEKLAGYLTKYLRKSFDDPALFGKKAYIASRNIARPSYDNGAIVSRYFCGLVAPDLSTAVKDFQKEYDTVYLGRCIYQRLILNPYD